MSGHDTPEAHFAAHTHGHGHGHDDHGDHNHGTFASYMTGFILSVILTALPFYIVMTGGFESKVATVLTLTGFAIVQIVVHMVYFLHMNGRAEGGWSMTALIFTLVVVVIMIAGSVWVMYNMDVNMMPSMHNMNEDGNLTIPSE